jgi:hypothetical protein
VSANDLTSDVAGPGGGFVCDGGPSLPRARARNFSPAWSAAGGRNEQALPAGPVHILEWDTLVIEGPMVAVDSDGRRWFTCTGQVSARAVRPVD